MYISLESVHSYTIFAIKYECIMNYKYIRMMINDVIVIVEYAETNLSAYIEGAPVFTTGKDLPEIKKNMQEAIDVYLESCEELQLEPVEILKGEINLKYRVDTATFINYYSSIFTKAALSCITGINERQLWHYAAGVHKPRKAQVEKIQQGVRILTSELQGITLI